MDLLSAISPKACLFLGKCGGIDKKNKIGDLILPIAAIRGEGTSNDYVPPEVPSLPAFMLQRAVSSAIRDYARDYWTGTVYTTNKRVWEYDERFKKYLEKSRAMAKASAKIKVTAEMFEDYSYIASEIQSEMMNYGLLFLDNEIYGGDGNDSTQPNHV
jgi:uridine phosphorylase